MQIYALFDYPYDGSRQLMGLFSSLELAERARGDLEAENLLVGIFGDFRIEPIQLDTLI